MATVELNACRNELARDIWATDDLDVLRTTRRAYRRAMQRRNLRMMELEKMNAKGLAPYTMDELNARIDEAEAEFAAGKGVPAEAAHQRMKQFIANL